MQLFLYTINDTVSIHAPVKDATIHWQKTLGHCVVSIHAPVKDATYIIYQSISTQPVSIHAPVKDATQY